MNSHEQAHRSAQYRQTHPRMYSREVYLFNLFAPTLLSGGRSIAQAKADLLRVYPSARTVEGGFDIHGNAIPDAVAVFATVADLTAFFVAQSENDLVPSIQRHATAMVEWLHTDRALDAPYFPDFLDAGEGAPS